MTFGEDVGCEGYFMSIQVNWDDDTRCVMRYVLDKDWTWEEFYTAKKQANLLMDAVPHKLGVIVDASHAKPFLPDLLTNTPIR
jgi:hypothetical protein